MDLQNYIFDKSTISSRDGVKGLTVTFTSNDELSKDEIDKRLKIYDYRCMFYKLHSPLDQKKLNFYEGVRDYISENDGFCLNIPLAFVFESSLHNSISKTRQDIAKFEKDVTKFINDAKLAVNTNTLLGLDLMYHPVSFVLSNGLIDERIRNPSGRDITKSAIAQMDNAYFVFTNIANRTMKNDEIAAELKIRAKLKRKVDDEKRKKNARDDLYRHNAMAIELIRRAVIGTFPYNEKGEWPFP